MSKHPGNLSAAVDSVADLELAIVSHRMFDHAVEEIEMLLARGAHEGRKGKRMRARGLLLRGAAGAGKSTVIQKILDNHPAFKGQDGIVRPVAVVEVPPAPSNRAVVNAIYSSLGYNAGREPTTEDIIKDLVGKTDRQQVKGLLLDESHHILSSRESAQVFEFLKSLLNRLGCSMIFAGLDQELEKMHEPLQLDRRLFPDVVLRPYDFENRVERLEFMSFLAAVEENALSFASPSHLSSQDFARRLYAASGGLIGIVTKYLSRAVLLANLRGMDRLDLPLLAEIDASWCGVAAPAKDVGFEADIEFEEGEDVAALLASAGRVPIDKEKNPFACAGDAVKGIWQARVASRLVTPQQRKLTRMKGAGPEPQRAF